MPSILPIFGRFAPILALPALLCCGSSQPGTGVTNTQSPPSPPVCAMGGADCHTNNDCCSGVCSAGSCVGGPGSR